MRKLFNSNKGQSVVELALILPVLIMILSAIVDFGWIFTNKLMITNFAREGARYGAVNTLSSSSASQIQNEIEDSIPDYAKSDVTVTVTYSNISDVRSGDIKIDIAYPVDSLTPLAGIFTSGQKINLTAECVMKVE